MANAPKLTNNSPANAPKNAKPGSKNNKSKNNANILDKMAQFQSRSLPILILIAVFLFFILFQYLKAYRQADDRLKQKIDTEIRKKLYYTDEYY